MPKDNNTANDTRQDSSKGEGDHQRGSFFHSLRKKLTHWWEDFSADGKPAEVYELGKQHKAVSDELIDMSSEVAAKQALVQGELERLQEQETDLEKAQLDLRKNFRASYKILQHRQDELEERYLVLQSRYDKLNNQQSDVTEDVKDLKRRCEELKEVCRSLENQHREAQRNHEHLQGKYRSLGKSHADLQREYRELNEKYEDALEYQEKLEGSHNQLHRNFGQLKTSTQILSDQHNELMLKHKKLEGQHERLSDSVYVIRQLQTDVKRAKECMEVYQKVEKFHTEIQEKQHVHDTTTPIPGGSARTNLRTEIIALVREKDAFIRKHPRCYGVDSGHHTTGEESDQAHLSDITLS